MTITWTITIKTTLIITRQLIEIKEMPHYHMEYTLIDNGSQLVVLRDLLNIWIFYINDNDGNEIELQI